MRFLLIGGVLSVARETVRLIGPIAAASVTEDTMPGTGHLSINGSTYDLAADFESAADLEDFDRRLQLLLPGNVTTDAFAVRIDGCETQLHVAGAGLFAVAAYFQPVTAMPIMGNIR